MCIVAAPGQRELDPLTLEGAARSGGSAGPPSSASHVVPTAGQSAFLPSSSGHRVRFQEAQMQPGLRPSPGSHPPHPLAPVPRGHQPRESQGPTQLQGGGGLDSGSQQEGKQRIGSHL